MPGRWSLARNGCQRRSKNNVDVFPFGLTLGLSDSWKIFWALKPTNKKNNKKTKIHLSFLVCFWFTDGPTVGHTVSPASVDRFRRPPWRRSRCPSSWCRRIPTWRWRSAKTAESYGGFGSAETKPKWVGKKKVGHLWFFLNIFELILENLVKNEDLWNMLDSDFRCLWLKKNWIVQQAMKTWNIQNTCCSVILSEALKHSDFCVETI